MKHLIPVLVLGLLALVALPTKADDEDPLVEKVITASKNAADYIEPSNLSHKPMAKVLAKDFVATTTDKHLLSYLIVYAFAEGAFSLDPDLPGDCKDANGLTLRPGTPKCTPKLVEAHRECCVPEQASHWCTLQVEPRPYTLEKCVSRGAEIMAKDVASTCVANGGTDTSATCCAHPGSIYATGGSCVASHRIDWRAKIAKHIEDTLNAP